MNIRKESSTDEDAISKLNDEAFNTTEEESAIITRLRISEELHLSLVAVEDDGKIIGHIAFSPMTIDNYTGNEMFMGLAPMAVDPAYQGKGIGSALITNGIEMLREQNVAAVFVLWLNHWGGRVYILIGAVFTNAGRVILWLL